MTVVVNQIYEISVRTMMQLLYIGVHTGRMRLQHMPIYFLPFAHYSIQQVFKICIYNYVVHIRASFRGGWGVRWSPP